MAARSDLPLMLLFDEADGLDGPAMVSRSSPSSAPDTSIAAASRSPWLRPRSRSGIYEQREDGRSDAHSAG